MKGAAFGETKTAAPVTGTAQAVAAGTITLAVGASAVDNAYRGMPVDGTSGTISGQRRWITAYNGTSKVATIFPDWTGASGTPGYSIPANANYEPITLSQKTLTLFGYQHDSVAANTSRLRKAKGAMGNGTISLRPSEPSLARFYLHRAAASEPDGRSPARGGNLRGFEPRALHQRGQQSRQHGRQVQRVQPRLRQPRRAVRRSRASSTASTPPR